MTLEQQLQTTQDTYNFYLSELEETNNPELQHEIESLLDDLDYEMQTGFTGYIEA